MRRMLGWLGLASVVVLGVAFALWNGGRQVTIDLGFVTLYRVPVTFVAFGGMVVGMGVTLIAGIHADLKVRALLREQERAGARPVGASDRIDPAVRGPAERATELPSRSGGNDVAPAIERLEPRLRPRTEIPPEPEAVEHDGPPRGSRPGESPLE